MGDAPNTLQCKHCKKPILKSGAAGHIKLCLQKKNDRAQRKKEQKEAARKAREARERGKLEEAEDENGAVNGDEDSVNGDKTTGKKSAVKANGTSDKGKKRKADAEADSEPKKKKTKKEIEAAKAKVVKPKGPVDVEKQCGVLLANGAFCARSLTCKSHAMGAKRAVPGRSLPYDMLLAAYQKKNQAKQQSKRPSQLNTTPSPIHPFTCLSIAHLLIIPTEAAIDANAPLPDDYADPSGPVDSDEEKDAVMAAIARSRPRPIAQHIFVPLRKKYAYVRVKEMLSHALGGRGGGNMFGGGLNAGVGAMSGSAAASGGDAGGAAGLAGVPGPEGVERRPSVSIGPGGRGSVGSAAGINLPTRKASGVVAVAGA
jgi:hypothetical protein